VYALSRYYWSGKKIRIRIYLVNNEEERKAMERRLLRSHVKIYGSLPICQGTTGSSYTTTSLEELDVSNDLSNLLDGVCHQS